MTFTKFGMLMQNQSSEIVNAKIQDFCPKDKDFCHFEKSH